MEHYFKAWAKTADYKGRASRREFVWFNGPLGILGLLLERLGDQLPDSVLFTLSIVFLVHIPPSLAQTVRRFHDADMRGWWVLPCLIPYVGLLISFVAFLKPPVDPNRFGPPLPSEPPSRLVSADWDPGRYFFKDAPATTATRAVAAGPLDEIERLAALRSGGGLTEAEFEILKATAMSRAAGSTAGTAAA